MFTKHFYIYSRDSCKGVYMGHPVWLIRCYYLNFNGKETKMDRVSIMAQHRPLPPEVSGRVRT